MIGMDFGRLFSSLPPLTFLSHSSHASAQQNPDGIELPVACCSNMDLRQVQWSAILETPADALHTDLP
ncbi:hypothetical protein B5V02_33305 [Mesorhizobium kowhaii]|uniref:Uncharacterized protein n=1 Tax=Mesorhizobium kowhaii TaxID=1300272 RepID=A0A2W7BVD7_9HYPH|nr:hypothetical protein B5V02_33305 [Mesorhizobium kowhaii]